MSKAFTPSAAKPGVITANDLREGYNVWMSADGWSADPADAILFEDAEAAEQALQQAIAQASLVVGPYMVEARRGPNGPEPTHFREAFRQTGPSNYFHGIQAVKAESANV